MARRRTRKVLVEEEVPVGGDRFQRADRGGSGTWDNSDRDKDSGKDSTPLTGPLSLATGQTGAAATAGRISQAELAKQESTERRKGVLFMSRVPPNMTIPKLRRMLSGFGGQVERIYLRPEEDGARERRKKAGGNRRLQFLDGWIEFSDKRHAKRLALMLNNQPMGGSHRDCYRDDLWNLKYLKKFKWSDLVGQLNEESHVREHRVRAEIEKAHEEAAEYFELLEKKRTVEKIQERAQAGRRRGRSEETAGDLPTPPPSKRSFRQRIDFSETRTTVLREKTHMSADLIQKLTGKRVS